MFDYVNNKEINTKKKYTVMWVYNKCDFILMRYFFDLIETCMEPGLISGGGCALFFSQLKG